MQRVRSGERARPADPEKGPTSQHLSGSCQSHFFFFFTPSPASYEWRDSIFEDANDPPTRGFWQYTVNLIRPRQPACPFVGVCLLRCSRDKEEEERKKTHRVMYEWFRVSTISFLTSSSSRSSAVWDQPRAWKMGTDTGSSTIIQHRTMRFPMR